MPSSLIRDYRELYNSKSDQLICIWHLMKMRNNKMCVPRIVKVKWRWWRALWTFFQTKQYAPTLPPFVYTFVLFSIKPAERRAAATTTIATSIDYSHKCAQLRPTLLRSLISFSFLQSINFDCIATRYHRGWNRICLVAKFWLIVIQKLNEFRKWRW